MKITILKGKLPKPEQEVIETDELLYFQLLSILADQIRLKDSLGVGKTLAKELLSRIGEVKENVGALLRWEGFVGCHKLVGQVYEELATLLEQIIEKFVGEKNASTLISEAGISGALSIVALKLGPKDLREEAIRQREEAVQKEKEKEIKRLAERERKFILAFLDGAESFCGRVLATPRITQGIRNEARRLNKVLRQERLKLESLSSKELKMGMALKLHEELREDLVVLRDALRDELLRREEGDLKLKSWKPSGLLESLQKSQYERLLLELRIFKAPERIEFEKLLHSLRLDVWKALYPLLPHVLKLVEGGGCRLLYRGSLTDGLRNAKKSLKTNSGMVAQLLNPKQFDVDAFVEVPDKIWKEWIDKAFLPGLAKSQGKISLTDVYNYLGFFLKKPETIEEGEKRDSFIERQPHALLLREKLGDLIEEMETVKKRLSSIEGYKRLKEVIDFSIILQPESQTTKQQLGGKPYTYGELARSLLQVEEIFRRHKSGLGEDDNYLLVIAPEIHIEIDDVEPPERSLL